MSVRPIESRKPFTRQTLVPIYNAHVLLTVGPCDPESNCAGRVGLQDGQFSIEFEREHITHRAVGHDVFHLTCRILARAGVTFAERDHEAHAYLCGWLHEWVYRTLKTARTVIVD